MSHEQVVLLHVSRYGRDFSERFNWPAVHAHLAAYFQHASIAKVEQIQQCRFASTTRTHYGQKLAWLCYSTHLIGKQS